jgi:hypothetical protein
LQQRVNLVRKGRFVKGAALPREDLLELVYKDYPVLRSPQASQDAVLRVLEQYREKMFLV